MPKRVLARAVGAVAAMTVALTAAPLTDTAQAYSATSGTLSFSGNAGEPISGGQSYEYTTGAVQMFDVQGSADENGLTLAIDADEGTLWRLIVAAPDGQKLTEGTTYTGAKQWPDAGPGDPELVFSGIDDGTEKGCNTNSGSFTIEHITFGPYGYVHELDATFEPSATCGARVPGRPDGSPGFSWIVPSSSLSATTAEEWYRWPSSIGGSGTKGWMPSVPSSGSRRTT